jgi:hypothetical protein
MIFVYSRSCTSPPSPTPTPITLTFLVCLFYNLRVLYCVVLYCVVLYCVVLYCVVLCCPVWFGLVWYRLVGSLLFSFSFPIIPTQSLCLFFCSLSQADCAEALKNFEKSATIFVTELKVGLMNDYEVFSILMNFVILRLARIH